MSKSNPSEVKLAVPTSGGFSGLNSLNLQVFVMIAAIIAIMLFFTWTTDGAYLSARNVSNLLRQTAITGILAVGMVFVIISAEIDLSVGRSEERRVGKECRCRWSAADEKKKGDKDVQGRRGIVS